MENMKIMFLYNKVYSKDGASCVVQVRISDFWKKGHGFVARQVTAGSFEETEKSLITPSFRQYVK